MALRIQKDGKQKPWTEVEISLGLEHFYTENKRYPTSGEIDTYPYLPSARSIQRRFGGLVSLRIKLGLKGPTDFTEGEYSSKRARSIGERAMKLKKRVHRFLVESFGEVNVHREYLFTDDRRTRVDFFIYNKEGNFSVDIFYPKDRHSMVICINSKLRTYSKDLMLQHPVIFVMMNDEISEDDIQSFLNNKKKKLRSYQHVMTYPQFKVHCATKAGKVSEQVI